MIRDEKQRSSEEKFNLITNALKVSSDIQIEKYHAMLLNSNFFMNPKASRYKNVPTIHSFLILISSDLQQLNVHCDQQKIVHFS